jgi:hypothetical protein
MGGDPKTPKDAVLDPEEMLDLLQGTSGPVGRVPPRARPPAASSGTFRLCRILWLSRIIAVCS